MGQDIERQEVGASVGLINRRGGPFSVELSGRKLSGRVRG